MKKLISVIAVLLILSLLGTVGAVAATGDDGLYAADNADEAVILTEAPDTEAIADYDSYELVIGDEVVLTVEQAEAPALTAGADDEGYFSVSFALPDTTKEVFLAGLSADKVQEIQQRIIDSYATGADFDLEDLSFIDTEKTREEDMDDELCWAASDANILTYTGWAGKAGLSTTDDVFDAFVSAYDNKGGHPYYGLGWFFNGVNNFPSTNADASSAAAGTGAYLTDYAFEQLCDIVDLYDSGVSGMAGMLQKLQQGYGISLSIDLYYRSSGAYSNGHSITCWGFVTDTAYAATDPAYYAGLFVTDSDSDELYNADRRDAPNILQAVSLTPFTSGDYQLFRFRTGNYTAVTTEYTWLAPYSPNVLAEDASDATRDKINTPDLYFYEVYLSTDLDADLQYEDKIESNTKFYYSPAVRNMADVSFGASAKYAITITDDNTGEEKMNTSFSTYATISPDHWITFGKQLTNSGLPAGDYTITFSVNTNHSVPEAYYYNNTYSRSLKVRDSYQLGDVDGDGDVTVMDVTQIQRILAKYSTGLDDNAALRGTMCGDELSIFDATTIQFYLAKYEVDYDINGKYLYD